MQIMVDHAIIRATLGPSRILNWPNLDVYCFIATQAVSEPNVDTLEEWIFAVDGLACVVRLRAAEDPGVSPDRGACWLST